VNAKKPDAPPKEERILFFPRNRIVRTILRGNRVYDPGKLYPEWDEKQRAPSHSSLQPNRSPRRCATGGFSVNSLAQK
jgi:hypothetical protein